MSNKKWPFEGDSPIARARKVALAYRNLAEQYEADLEKLRLIIATLDTNMDHPHERIPKVSEVKSLDERFTSWGETWHCEQHISYGPDDMVNAKIAGQLIQVSTGTIGRQRRTGRIKAKWVRGGGEEVGRYLYKVSDVYALSEKLRGRAWRRTEATDTVTDTEEVTPNER